MPYYLSQVIVAVQSNGIHTPGHRCVSKALLSCEVVSVVALSD